MININKSFGLEDNAQLNNRVDWVDMAKGITIILVIIGHVVPFDSATRNVIFSFHMLLFFILSGYSYKLCDDKQKFFLNLKKNFCHLFIPALYISGIFLAYKFIYLELFSKIGGGGYEIIKETLASLYYASGIPFNGHPALGMPWFLISLFWSKTILDFIHINFQGKSEYYLYIGLGLLGIGLGLKGRWLAQNLDVTLVSILFISCGILWKKYSIYIERYELGVFCMATTIWTIFLANHMYLEMAIRSYPGIILSSIEAIAGTFFVCCMCKGIKTNIIIKKYTSFLGRYSLIIFCIHCIDYLFPYLWEQNTVGLTVINRVALDLIVFHVWYVFKIGYNKLKG